MFLLPILVVEEHVRRTINGENVAYVVETLNINGSSKKFNLDASKSDVFEDIHSARDFLINNAVAAIDSLCEVATKKSLIFNERRPVKRSEENIHENLREEDVQDVDYVLLENGRRAKIKTNPI